MLSALEDYHKLAGNLTGEPLDAQLQICRHLAKTDLFFLLWFVCGRKDMAHPWLLERCKEVCHAPDGYLDLWAREHYKSTIITFGKTIQDILQNPNITVGIFSHTRPNAKAFLKQIKREFETNELLKALFPDVLYADPRKESPKWSEDDGLIVKRNENPKESTIEAWGLVDGQPTGKHFRVRIYDDVVVPESVTTPEMIQKTTDAWAMSNNLGAMGGIARHIGTRYHFNDTYREVIGRGTAKPRIYAATADGTPDGEPVLLDKEALAKKRRDQGAYIFASQMLQNPKGDETQGFKRIWLKWHKGSDGAGMNIYILVDPASEKKKTSDYTVMAVVAMGADENYYLLDALRDRLNLTQKADHLFRMVKKWKPINVGYEKYGMQADIEYIKERMSRENYHFNITELGGKVPKSDRIRGLIPIFESGRFYLPDVIFKTLYDGRTVDLIEQFLNEEYDAFPVPVHDDMLDAIARITDPELSPIFPRIDESDKKDAYASAGARRGSAWSA
jgi:phage terminase large subunit-like protein